MSDYNDLELQEQLMNQLEEMQTEIDQYKLTIADLQSEVSKKDSQLSEVLEQAETLSRENSSLNSQLEQARQSANSSEVYQLREAISELRKDNRQKSETIKSLNERIGTLSESDNVLKQNAELKQKNSELQRSEQNARQEAKATVSAVKEQYANKQAELERKIASAEYRERQASTLEANLSHQADTRAQKLAENKLKALQGEYEAKKRTLDSEYKTLTVVYEGFLLGCLLYGVLVTLFTAVRSEAFISDFKTFYHDMAFYRVACRKPCIARRMGFTARGYDTSTDCSLYRALAFMDIGLYRFGNRYCNPCADRLFQVA